MWLRPGSVHANFCAAGVSLTAGWPGSRLSGGSLPVLAAFRMLGERRACGDSLAAVLWESTRSRSSAKDASSSLPTTTMLQTALSTAALHHFQNFVKLTKNISGTQFSDCVTFR